MSQFESETPFDGDWDDKGGLTWNEFDWRKYLKESDREIARFLSIYNSLKDQPDHLDEAAHLMGWDVDDWSNAFESEESEDDAFDPESQREYEDSDPYTLHKHPVFVVTRALHEYVRHSWEHYMLHSRQHLTPEQVWGIANSLHRSELFAILGLQSLDLGDFALTVCHLKTALTAVNQAFSTLQSLTHRDRTFLSDFRRETYIRLFDLREVWLRVIQDCREEVRRRKGGNS